MRLLITFSAVEPIFLPVHYNNIVQGFIYNFLDKILANQLHDGGFIYKKRKFKLFTFSRIFGKLRKDGDKFKIFPPFKLFISSPYTEMLQNLALNLMKNSEVRLDSNTVWVESLQVLSTPQIGKELVIKMLSPVTVYSTLYRPDGKKKTYYYNPSEKEFSEILKQNIIKKYFAFYEKMPPSEEFFIEPIKVRSKDEKIVLYKGFVIKGWMGVYRLRGEPELLKLAYEAGLGGKNSQGFGMFEILK